SAHIDRVALSRFPTSIPSDREFSDSLRGRSYLMTCRASNQPTSQCYWQAHQSLCEAGAFCTRVLFQNSRVASQYPPLFSVPQIVERYVQILDVVDDRLQIQSGIRLPSTRASRRSDERGYPTTQQGKKDDLNRSPLYPQKRTFGTATTMPLKNNSG